MYEYLASKVEKCCSGIFFIFPAICSAGAQSSCRCDDYCISQPQRGQWIQGKPWTPNLCLFYKFYFIWMICAWYVLNTRNKTRHWKQIENLALPECIPPVVFIGSQSVHVTMVSSLGFYFCFLWFLHPFPIYLLYNFRNQVMLCIKNMKNEWWESGK